jgi:hypothetical protein
MWHCDLTLEFGSADGLRIDRFSVKKEPYFGEFGK